MTANPGEEALIGISGNYRRSGSRVRLDNNSAWTYPDLAWGNECPAIPASSVYEGSVRLRLADNDSIDVNFTDR